MRRLKELEVGEFIEELNAWLEDIYSDAGYDDTRKHHQLKMPGWLYESLFDTNFDSLKHYDYSSKDVEKLLRVLRYLRFASIDLQYEFTFRDEEVAVMRTREFLLMGEDRSGATKKLKPDPEVYRTLTSIAGDFESSIFNSLQGSFNGACVFLPVLEFIEHDCIDDSYTPFFTRVLGSSFMQLEESDRRTAESIYRITLELDYIQHVYKEHSQVVLQQLYDYLEAVVRNIALEIERSQLNEYGAYDERSLCGSVSDFVSDQYEEDSLDALMVHGVLTSKIGGIQNYASLVMRAIKGRIDVSEENKEIFSQRGFNLAVSQIMTKGSVASFSPAKRVPRYQQGMPVTATIGQEVTLSRLQSLKHRWKQLSRTKKILVVMAALLAAAVIGVIAYFVPPALLFVAWGLDITAKAVAVTGASVLVAGVGLYALKKASDPAKVVRDTQVTGSTLFSKTPVATPAVSQQGSPAIRRRGVDGMGTTATAVVDDHLAVGSFQ